MPYIDPPHLEEDLKEAEELLVWFSRRRAAWIHCVEVPGLAGGRRIRDLLDSYGKRRGLDLRYFDTTRG